MREKSNQPELKDFIPHVHANILLDDLMYMIKMENPELAVDSCPTQLVTTDKKKREDTVITMLSLKYLQQCEGNLLKKGN